MSPWVLALIGAVVIAIATVVAWLSIAPWTCPRCHRINGLRRERRGRRHEVANDDGDVIETWTEIHCRRCRENYWLVRSDGLGVIASLDFTPLSDDDRPSAAVDPPTRPPGG